MNCTVKVNCFFILILCSIVSCEIIDWLCPVNSSNKSVHEYVCRTTINAIDDDLNQKNCHFISNDLIIPSNTEVTELKIKYCECNVIGSCLNVYENVISLDISNSGCDSLESLDLNHKFLKKLNASYNIFEKIPRNFFANIPQVTEVDFSNNNDLIINSESFKSASKLTTIHLSHINLISISKENFAHLNDLVYIDLRQNSVHLFKDNEEIFKNNKKLKVVHLERSRYGWNVPIIPFATSVYTTWNKLSDVDIDGLGKKIRIIANSSDEGYFRTSSDYTELHCNEHSFVNVERLTVGPNRIENIEDLFKCFGSSPLLLYLNLSGNPIRNVNSTIISRFPRLIVLTLGNTQLESFDFALLQQLPDINALDISNNSLKTLENLQLIKTFKSLQQINLANNDLKNISEIVDSLGSSIDALNLSRNFVGDINQIDFTRFKNLYVTSLQNTSLQLGDVNPFEENTNLKIFDISDNNLAGWNISTMAKTLNQLKGLSAAGCQIEFSNDIIKDFGPDLLVMDVPNNYLGELSTSSFKSNVLTLLNLTNVGMIKFELDSSLPLYNLNISFNQLTELNFAVAMNKLETLDIEGNNITELINFDKSKIPKLTELNIANNNLSCEYLVQLLERIKSEWPELEMKGDPYKQKHDEDCHPNIN